eukprot:9367690-Alexandrium_andersonii.AAC.1
MCIRDRLDPGSTGCRPTFSRSRSAMCSSMRRSARSIRGSWASLSMVSNLRLQSSECRAPADGRP